VIGTVCAGIARDARLRGKRRSATKTSAVGTERPRSGTIGQSVVEFAIALPLLVLILAIVLDAGRVFYGWVNLQNAARIATNYAATHPDQWPSSPQPSGYLAEIQRDTTSIDCDLRPIPGPVFSDPAKSVGSTVSVVLACDFHPLTPIISSFFSGVITAGSTETFAVRSGILAAVPTPPPPTPTPAPTPTSTPVPTPTPTATPSTSGSPAPTSTSTASPTISPGVCVVPTMMGIFTADAAIAWRNAGFNPQLLNVQISPGNSDYRIGTESVGSTVSVWDGTQQSCATFQLNVGKANGQ